MTGVNVVNGFNSGVSRINVNNNVSKPVNNTPSQKFAEPDNKKMSTGMKVGLGAAAVAVSVIAGLAIKNKAAAKKALKELNAKHCNIEKCGKIGMEDVLKRIDDVADKFSSDELCSVKLISPKKIKEVFKLNNDLPKNSFGIMYNFKNGKPRILYLVHDGMDKSLAEAVKPAWEQNKIYVIPVD